MLGPISRRVFIHRLTFLGGGVVLLGGTAACRKDEAHATARHVPEVLTTSHLTFTDDEFEVVAAAVDRIIPKDGDPGALDANVPEYIDRMLQTPELHKMREDFVEGLGHLNKRARSMFAGRTFTTLKADEKDDVLRGYKDSAPDSGEAHFYELLVTLTLEGFLGDPTYGGNRNRVGWALVGFDPGEPMPHPGRTTGTP
jgi:gluconate 2-dehydrogenase gamma chain